MVDLSSLRGKRFYIVGLGGSGKTALSALYRAGVAVSGWDDAEGARTGLDPNFPILGPEHIDYQGMAGVILAPGIPHTYPQPHPVVALAAAEGAPILCDVDVLAMAQPHLPVIGVTGTNGKSTTTALIGHILGQWLKVAVGGNLGPAALGLDTDGAACAVLELSSYMLERCPHLVPDVAIHLNFTKDHIDRHGSMEGYVAAKEHLFDRAKGQRLALIGVDDPYSEAMAARVRARGQHHVVPVSVTRPLDDGYYVQAGWLYGPGHVQLVDLARIERLRGAHNAQNMAMDFAACAAFGLSIPDIEAGLHSFAGLPHRQFLARTIGGIRYINDSKATNADATEKALQAYDGIHWIVGGLAKEGGLAGLERYKNRIRAAYLIGAAATDFASFMEQHGIPFTQCDTLDVAVKEAHKAAQAQPDSSTVLLSPACASFDQFTGYAQRGEMFEQMVQALPCTASRAEVACVA